MALEPPARGDGFERVALSAATLGVLLPFAVMVMGKPISAPEWCSAGYRGLIFGLTLIELAAPLVAALAAVAQLVAWPLKRSRPRLRTAAVPGLVLLAVYFVGTAPGVGDSMRRAWPGHPMNAECAQK